MRREVEVIKKIKIKFLGRKIVIYEMEKYWMGLRVDQLFQKKGLVILRIEVFKVKYVEGFQFGFSGLLF